MIPLQIQRQKLDEALSKYNLEKLLPPQSAKNIKWTQQQLFFNVHDNTRRRKIFFGVEYSTEEQQHIQKLKKQMIKKKIPDIYPDPILLKYLYATDFNHSKSLQRLKFTYEFITKSQEAQLNQNTFKILQKGLIYNYGRDKMFRPVVIVRVDRFDFDQKKELIIAVYFTLYITQRYRMIPYHAQKWCIIFDFGGLTISQLPYMRLYDSMIQVGNIFCGNVEKTFIVNAKGIDLFWKMGKHFVPAHNRPNIIFVNQFSELHQYISPNQLEQRYGGLNKNLKQYWPPKNIGEQQQKIEVTSQQNLSYYESIINNSKMFKSKIFHFEQNRPREEKKQKKERKEKRMSNSCSLCSCAPF